MTNGYICIFPQCPECKNYLVAAFAPPLTLESPPQEIAPGSSPAEVDPSYGHDPITTVNRRREQQHPPLESPPQKHASGEEPAEVGPGRVPVKGPPEEHVPMPRLASSQASATSSFQPLPSSPAELAAAAQPAQDTLGDDRQLASATPSDDRHIAARDSLLLRCWEAMALEAIAQHEYQDYLAGQATQAGVPTAALPTAAAAAAAETNHPPHSAAANAGGAPQLDMMGEVSLPCSGAAGHRGVAGIGLLFEPAAGPHRSHSVPRSPVG